MNPDASTVGDSGVPTRVLPPLPPPLGSTGQTVPPPPSPNAAPPAPRSPQASANAVTDLGPGRFVGPGASTQTRKIAMIVIAAALVSTLVAAYWVGQFLSSVKTINSVEMGECLEDFFPSDESGYGEVYLVQTTSCDEPHALEVYAVTDTLWLDDEPVGTIVDMDELFARGEEWCVDQFQFFVGERYETSRLEMWTFVPMPASWRDGDRTVQCLVGEYDQATLTTGTLRNSAGRDRV